MHWFVPFHWIWSPMFEKSWFGLPCPQVQICSFVPSAVEPPETSRHLFSKIVMGPEKPSDGAVQVMLPFGSADLKSTSRQPTITTAAPSASDSAARQCATSSVEETSGCHGGWCSQQRDPQGKGRMRRTNAREDVRDQPRVWEPRPLLVRVPRIAHPELQLRAGRRARVGQVYAQICSFVPFLCAPSTTSRHCASCVSVTTH
ncbi:unnamed protein product [Mycena citricolor]|uniref:Uncharacterized protein n=1 Tax=Mycena citricolor TaxID=2018698 RepID=A0AAD2H6B7_9AGAR|nr:unnamed protein product [Mycena citricolor]